MYKPLLGVFLLSSFASVAQPVLTGANSNPTIGTSIVYYATDAITPGSGGANVTWDFSAIPNNGSSTSNYIACSAAPDCAAMTGTTIVGDNGSNYLYLIADATRYTIRGIDVNNTTFNYSDPVDWTHFPFTYNDTYVDPFSVDYTSGMTFHREGTITVTADGYGTLILPSGTYTNVLRIKHVEHYTDEVMGSTMFTYHNEQYRWYKPNVHDILLSSSDLSINGTPMTTTAFYTDLDVPTSVSGNGELESTLKVFPVPATDVVNISFKAEQQQVNINLLDMTGRTVASAPTDVHAQGVQTKQISTSHLARGMYMLSINDGIETVVRKVQLQ